MAVWQFDCNIIPKRNVVANSNPEELAQWLPEDMEQTFTAGTLDRLKSILKPTAHWSNAAQRYGREDGTNIEIWREDVNEVNLRLDMRTLILVDAVNLCELVGQWGCGFLIRRDFVEPDIAALLPYLINSGAFDFAKDQKGFIEKLSNESALST